MSAPVADRIPARAYLLLALIVLLAALLRFPDLQTAPVGGHGDVAWVGLNALDWTDRGIWPFYVRELYSPEFPIVYLDGLLLPVTGISYLTPRLITATTGLIFVALLFPATWNLTAGKSSAFRERASLLAALAGAVSLHAMYLSRLGMESPPFLAAVTLLVWLTAWAYQRSTQDKRWHRWVLAGAALALAQYIYLPARLLPIVLALWIAHSWWSDRAKLPATLRGWLIMAVTAFVLTLPAIILFVTVPGSFSGRADTGTAITGGWVWSYDTSAEGGLVILMLKKIALTVLAFGIYWNGPYTIMGQPMLTPLFFLGLLIGIGALVRFPRQIAYAWPALAIPVMLLTDLISGAVAEIHALHQMGILPFVFILSGLGLSHAWDALTSWIQSRQSLRAPMFGGLLALAVVPSLVGTYRYLNTVIPAQYADPETGWRTEQIDVDVSQRILAQPGRAYLLPYEEYSRSNVAWLLSQSFRERRSAINAEGQLQIDQPPAELIVVMTDTPDRPRHDARPSESDTRLWVLLDKGVTWLLPPFTLNQEQGLLDGIKRIENPANGESLLDRSKTEIARLYSLETPSGLFTPRPVIDHPLDAIFNEEVQLKGYTIRAENLTPGKAIFVTLYWQALKPPVEDYEIFVQAWNDAKESIAGIHDFPYGGAYRVRIWRPTEIVATHHWLQLPDNLPIGRYTLAIGMSHLIGEKRLAVTGSSADSSLQVVLAPDLRVPQPSATSGTPSPHVIRFGDTFEIGGLDVKIGDAAQSFGTTWKAAPGQTQTIDLTWKTLKRPPKDYSVFLHLSPATDAPPIVQVDLTMGGTYPAGAWRTGDLVRDHLSLSLPNDLKPGSYPLLLGVYFWQSGERLPVSLDGIDQANGQIQIGTVEISK